MGKRSLDPLREQLAVLVNQANARVAELKQNQEMSRALIEAERSFKAQTSRSGEEELFKANFHNRRQIKREFARVQQFLNDYTSTLEGAENFTTSLSDLAGAFGGQWKARTGENYDTTRINKALAEKTFDLYRRAVEAAGGWERAVGMFQGGNSLVGYGSENLINAIYDMVQNEDSVSNMDEFLSKFHTDDNTPVTSYEEAILLRARAMIETGIENYKEMTEKMRSDYDYGIIQEDPDRKARRAFYIWRRNLRKEKRK